MARFFAALSTITTLAVVGPATMVAGNLADQSVVAGKRLQQDWPQDSSGAKFYDSSDSVAKEGSRDSSDADDGSSESAVIDNDSSGGVSSSRCKAIGGGVPSLDYSRLKIDDDEAQIMEEFYNLARQNCDDTRILLMGDSILYHLRYSSECTRKIYSSFGGKGFNFGMSGIGGKLNAKLTRWIFEETCIAPHVVYLALGVINCFNGRTGTSAIEGIIDSIKIIKHYSPDTHVVVQKMLPTTKPYTNFVGKKWTEQDYYQCAGRINQEVGSWIQDHQGSCISHVDFEDLVLDSSGRFRPGAYEDGVHFLKKGDVNGYCGRITNAVKPFSGNDISTRGTSFGWVDTEPFTYALKNESFYRWTYNNWAECDGACGKQMRTAQCMLQHHGNSTLLEPVGDAFCMGAFMNPLERACNITDDCIDALWEDRGPLSMQDGNVLQYGNDKKSASHLTYILVAAGAGLAVVCSAFAVVLHMVALRKKEGETCTVEDNKHPAKEEGYDGVTDHLNDEASSRSISIPALVTSSDGAADTKEANV